MESNVEIQATIIRKKMRNLQNNFSEKQINNKQLLFYLDTSNTHWIIFFKKIKAFIIFIMSNKYRTSWVNSSSACHKWSFRIINYAVVMN